MNKYGIEHFQIEQIEEVPDNQVAEREQYWISYYDSYHKGYNATRGGEGKLLYDYDLIVKTYKQYNNIKETAKALGISTDTVHDALTIKNCPIKSSSEILKEKTSKPVNMLDKQNYNIIQSFSSTKDAAKYLIQNKVTTSLNDKGIASHISDVCNGKRKSAYGYFWQYK